mgnify:FL=1
MSQLTRVKTGGFFLKDCYKLSEIEEKVKEGCVGEVIRPVESFFLNYPRLNVTPEGDRRLKNGNLLEEEHIASLEEQKEEITPAWFRVHDMEGEFQALYEKRNGTYHPAKTFFR